jgi:eukaryotic-like serine/threonine-protein kinase
MQPERRQEIEALFEAALDQPTGARSRWVRSSCVADEGLRDAVLRLLNAHERAEGILDRPAHAGPVGTEDEVGFEPERRIGAYRLVREIGRGGMSLVYLAERDDRQFRQTVAVKVIRRGLDTPDLVHRFSAERQILASLNHPNIARLLDGGTTEDGLPYLVMEHVAGEAITDHCDRHRLTLEQRLRLFVTVARAVQHAHRNLVVHRDLKPSNILVTEAATAQAGDGEVKLLDFGIAKLLDPHASAAAPQTRPGVRLMTPEYASPEQLEGGAVTTATDVYGLGIVLYELLSGHHPFSLADALKGEPRSRAQEPICPSSAVASDAEISHARRTHPEGLRRKLRGDLDRIVLSALRNEPERRYPSAEQMAEDIEHFLARRPIRARGDSVAYRVGKFTARHRWAVAVAAMFVLLLAGYAATLTVKEREVRAALEHASLEAERAEQVTAFLMRLFETTDPNEVGSDAITARELLERGAARAEQFSHQPAAQAQMLDVIGRTYQHLGQYDRAQPLLERALGLRRGLFGDLHSSVAESLYHLARLHHARGEFDSAEVRFRRALHTQRELLGADHARVARTLGGLARVLQDRGDYGQAELLAREALDVRRRVLGYSHPEVAQSLHDLAEIFRRQGNYAPAEPLYREALALQQQLLGNDHPAVAETSHNLAFLLQRRGKLDEVEPLYRQALGIHQRFFGDDHPATASTTSNLGLLMFRLGDLPAADSLYRKALATRRKILSPDHPDIALSLGLLAAVQRRLGELASAQSLYRESLALQRRAFGDEHPDMAHGMNGLALVMRDKGDFSAADSLYEAVLAMRLRLLGENHSTVAQTLNDRGVLMREWGNYPRAESLLLQALEKHRESLGEEHLQTRQSARHLVTLYQRWDRPADAAKFREMLDGN